MKRALQAARAFSQQALRQEAPASGRGVSGASHAPPAAAKKPLELDGRSYLLPTLTLSRTAARKLGEAHVNFQTRARKTPIVLDLQMVSSDGASVCFSDLASVYVALARTVTDWLARVRSSQAPHTPNRLRSTSSALRSSSFRYATTR